MRTARSKQLNDKIYSSVARLPLAIRGPQRPKRRVVDVEGRPWAECRMPRVEIREAASNGGGRERQSQNIRGKERENGRDLSRI